MHAPTATKERKYHTSHLPYLHSETCMITGVSRGTETVILFQTGCEAKKGLEA